MQPIPHWPGLSIALLPRVLEAVEDFIGEESLSVSQLIESSGYECDDDQSSQSRLIKRSYMILSGTWICQERLLLFWVTGWKQTISRFLDINIAKWIYLFFTKKHSLVYWVYVQCAIEKLGIVCNFND